MMKAVVAVWVRATCGGPYHRTVWQDRRRRIVVRPACSESPGTGPWIPWLNDGTPPAADLCARCGEGFSHARAITVLATDDDAMVLHLQTLRDLADIREKEVRS